MSTNDVPGARKSNRDELAMGCWAEHEDGSLILVESTENGRVIYSVFDTEAEVEYRDSMSIRAFKKEYSYDSKKKNIRWTWHDKTPFPWDRVIAEGARDGMRYPSADHLISAAERVARSRGLKGSHYDPEDYDHKVSKDEVGGAARMIAKGIQKAIESLRS